MNNSQNNAFLQYISQLVNDILKELPICYYLKTKSNLTIEYDNTSSTSYYDPRNNKIMVALSNIIDSLKGAVNQGHNVDDALVEKKTRCFLYHELSHAILTPPALMSRANRTYTKDLLNIIEDERIETIFKNYYLNVDFKENVKQICPLNKNATSFEHFVFNALRLRYTPPKYKIRIQIAWKNFINNTYQYASRGYNVDSYLFWYMANLIDILRDCYNDYLTQQQINQQNNTNQQPNQTNSSSSKSSDSSSSEQSQVDESEDDGDDESDNTDSDSKDNSDTDSEDEDDTEDEDDDNEDDTEDTEDDDTEDEDEDDISEDETMDDLINDDDMDDLINVAIKNFKKSLTQCGSQTSDMHTLNDYTADKKTKIELLKILGNACGFGKTETPTLFGYNGRFTPKQFMTDFNDEMKWFKKKCYDDTGVYGKKADKKTLNIWLDNSGSYGKNDEITNSILKSLAEIEEIKKDFIFNLITFDDTHYEKSGIHRISTSYGGTEIPLYLNELYKKYNPLAKELNIMLLDGEADDLYRLAVMNNNRSVFITDSSNYNAIRNYCPYAKKIINNVGSYPDNLALNIIEAFKSLF